MGDPVQRARELLTKITPGPWVIEREHSQHLAYDLPIYDAKENPVSACPDCGVRGGFETGTAEFIAAAPQLVQELADEVERLRAESAKHRRLSGQANYLLARIIAAANLSAIDGDDGFVASYNLPVGPIHKAIPFLNEQGIVVTNDGQIKNAADHG
jgi:hypothetical protein